jgi:outer membrane protein assembly factor BamB
MRSPIVLCAAALLFAAAQACAQSGASWPRFRGPNRDNVSPDRGLLSRWPQEGPRLLWKAAGIGGGYSSVAIAGGRIYTLGNRGADTYLVALDQASGNPIWSAKVGKAGSNLGCTPTVDGDRVYAIGQEGDVVCAATESGAVRWRKNLQTDFGGACGGWSYTESPLVDGDRVVCTPGAKDALLVALDKRTGALIWKCASPFGDSTAGYSSVAVAEVGGVRHYVQLTAGGVVGVDASTGKLLWSYDRLGNNTANIPTPIVLKDQVFCAAGYGKGGALLQLAAESGGVAMKEVYYNRELTNKHGGLVAVGGHVYGDYDDTGRPFCAELKTGRIVWRKQERGPGRGSAAVTYADGHLYFRFDNGYMALVEASPAAYNEISTFKIPGSGSSSWAHPVVVGGKMYLREQDNVLCYDVKQP